MTATKRERQKAARRERLERIQRHEKRKKNIRRGVIVAIVAALVVGLSAFLFSGNKTATTTTTTTTTSSSSTTTTTSAMAASFAPVAHPSPAGTSNKAPTVVVPPGKPPTAMELSNLITGTGAEAKNGDTVQVEYVLATYSTRKVIQSSWTSQPFSFVLGANPPTVIQGWEDGVVGMRVGGRRELVIPPSLGYDDKSAGAGIAKNDTLVFVIDLRKISAPT